MEASTSGCWKVAYPNRQLADESAQLSNAQNRESGKSAKERRKVMRAYRCPLCHLFHLSHERPRTKR